MTHIPGHRDGITSCSLVPRGVWPGYEAKPVGDCGILSVEVPIRQKKKSLR